ncbi:LuxR C-terminal-related transcriptional regulator, partial [Bacillus subtilis]
IEAVTHGRQEGRNELLAALVQKSVLLREDSDGVARYRLLETIRTYGAEQLAESVKSELEQSHMEYYKLFTQRVAANWFGPDQEAWYRRLMVDKENVDAAAAYCWREDLASGCQIVWALRDFWFPSGLLNSMWNWLGNLQNSSYDVPGRSRVTCLAANLAFMQGKIETGRQLLDSACQETDGSRDELSRPYIAYSAAMAALFADGDLERARNQFEEAAILIGEAGDGPALCRVLARLATVSLLEGNIDSALASIEKCVLLCEPLGEQWNRSLAFWLAGIAHWLRGDFEEAARCEQQSILLKRPFNDALGVALALDALAWVELARGNARRSAVLLGAMHGLWSISGVKLFDHFRKQHNRCQEEAQRRLGRQRFQNWFEQGSKMTFEEATTIALKDDATKELEDQTENFGLTDREYEIAELLAQGMSNKEISAHLFISPRTTENHV